MTRKYFGTDGIRGRVGEAPITPDFCLRLGLGRRSSLRAQRSSTDPDRKRHADIRLHVRVCPRGRTLVRGCRRTPARADADAGGRVSHAHAARRRRHCHQRLAQSVLRQRHQVLRFGTATNLPDAKELEIEAELDSPLTCVTSEADRQSEAGRGRAWSLHRILQGHRRSRHAAERLQDRARLREWRDLRRGAGRLRGTGCRCHRDRGGPRRPEHQCRLRLDASGAASERGTGAQVQTSVSRSMATAIAC